MHSTKTLILIAAVLSLACLSCRRSGSDAMPSSQASPTPQADANARALAQFKSLLFADQSLEEVAKIVEMPRPEPANDPFALFALSLKASQAGNVDEAKKSLQQVLAMPNTEARVRLWAWKGLRDLGERPSAEIANEVHGIVCELNNEEGVGTIAAYADGSIRWIGGKGNVTVWDAPDGDAEINRLVNELLKSSEPLVNNAPATDKHKTPEPELDHFRVSILTFGGIHTVESFGPDIDEKHALAPALVASAKLVEAVSKKSQAQPKKGSQR
jgi:hypothetical protein